jgi:hypothetical protein
VGRYLPAGWFDLVVVFVLALAAGGLVLTWTRTGTVPIVHTEWRLLAVGLAAGAVLLAGLGVGDAVLRAGGLGRIP